jgi:hypothetical protein
MYMEKGVDPKDCKEQIFDAVVLGSGHHSVPVLSNRLYSPQT